MSPFQSQDLLLLYRYTTAENKKPLIKAKIYAPAEHGIGIADIDLDALRIVKRLTAKGFKAYIVGGAVRDLLLKKTPKDFDLATDARPKAIRRLFRYSRIIGRRFKLVHVHCRKGKVIEVSTFRSESKDNNIYGTLGEDALRRDFTFNALFYCPQKQQVIDYVDGIVDIWKRRVRVLGCEKESFVEDPVRMIRAVKYAAMLNFKIPFFTCLNIKRYRFEMEKCSPDRLTEEIFKIFESGKSHAIVLKAHRLRLLEVVFPFLHKIMSSSGVRIDQSPLCQRLVELDRLQNENGQNSRRGEVLAVLLVDLIDTNPHWNKEPLPAIQRALRINVRPLIPSNRELLDASRIIKNLLRKNMEKEKILSLQRRASMR
jgi:poly(A) polymerase